MIQVKIDPRILQACPETRIGLIRSTVVNEPTCDALWAEIEAAAQLLRRLSNAMSCSKSTSAPP